MEANKTNENKWKQIKKGANKKWDQIKKWKQIKQMKINGSK